MRGHNSRRPAAASTSAAAPTSIQRDPEDDSTVGSEESGDEEVVSSSSRSESESESDGDAERERELERALADVPFGELQRARADGSLAPRAASAASAQKKARRENRKRPMEISTNVRPPRFREVIQVPRKVVRDPRFEPIYGPLDKEGFRKRYNFLFDDELPAEKEEAGKLDAFMEKRRRKNASKDHRYMPKEWGWCIIIALKLPLG